MKVIGSIGETTELVGQELGVSQWKEIDQKRIDEFAGVTEDHQWIHVDVDRANAESPYGATIAHGFLSLSLIPGMTKDIYRIEGKMGINYGLNKVRFLGAVTAGSRIRIRAKLLEANVVSEDTVNLTVQQTIEIEGREKPAAVVEMIARWIF
jgi:acyl dehydratase